MPHKDYEAHRAYQREYQKKWAKANPEKVKATRERAKERVKAWRDAHPEQVRAWARTANAKFRANNLELVRKRDLTYYRKREYGINEFDFHSMIVAQTGRCAICKDEFAKTPHIDHDHESEQVRGLLCGTCNVGIAMLRHDPELLENAGKYLGRFS